MSLVAPGPRPDAAGPQGALAGRGAALVLLLAVLVAYARAVGAEFSSLDDYSWVVFNPQIQAGLTWKSVAWAFTTLDQSNWVPLTRLSFLLDAQLYGMFSPGFHLTNIFLHAGAVLLFHRVLLEATGEAGPSALAAGLWALHPQHVEAVVWVTARKDVLSAVFWMLCCLAWVRYAQGKKGWYALALVFMVLGGMAKQMVVTLPVILLLLDFWPLRRVGRVPWSRLLAEKLPFVALAGALALRVVTAHAGSALVPLSELPLVPRLLNALASLSAYLGQTVVPVGLAPFYPHPGAGVSLWQAGLGGLLLAGISLAAWRWRRRWPWLLMGWLWFLVALAPVIGIVQTWLQARADRFVYLPHAGLFMALAWSAAAGFRRLGLGRRTGAVLAAAALLALGTLTFRQAALWREPEILFTHAAQVTEGNFIAELVLAGEARMRDDQEEADRHYAKAAQYNPAYLAGVHYRRGLERLQAGEAESGIEDFRIAFRLNPKHVGAMNALALFEWSAGREAEAGDLLRRVLAGNPEDAGARTALDTLRRARDAAGQGRVAP